MKAFNFHYCGFMQKNYWKIHQYHFANTGCFIMKVKKFELHTRARIQAVIWERCTFSNEILTFWNCAFKNSKEFHVFFRFGRNFDAQILKICKIHWKLMFSKKIRISIPAKFDIYVHETPWNFWKHNFKRIGSHWKKYTSPSSYLVF